MRTAPSLLLIIVLVILGAGCAPSNSDDRSARVEERADFAEHFREAGAVGTFVLYDPGEGRHLVHNAERARERFIPASTFKILNSLVALETGVVADTTTVFAWDGVERSIPAWNRDHTLATAYEHSVVWAYQEVARRIGETRMRDYVRRSAYGNESIGGAIDLFWLTGDLRISPMEQAAFLERLHERQLPFSDRTVALIEGIMVEERGPRYILRGKTGLADGTPADVGWYVGYVVRETPDGDRPYYFALEMDVERPEQIAARRSIARAVLIDLGLL